MVEEAIASLKEGRQILLRPQASTGLPRFVLTPADRITPQLVSAFSEIGQGQIYLALSDEQCERLQLSMPSEPAPGGGNQVDAIDAREGIGSGLSAEDRAQTIRLASSPAAAARDFVKPGHVLPLRASPNGVLDRPRPTEAAVDLVKLCGEGEGAVLAPLVGPDHGQVGGLALGEMLEITDDDVIAHRWRTERLLEVATTAAIPTPAGEFRVVGFQEKVSGDVHLAFVSGDLGRRHEVLVSAHVECVLGSNLRGRLCGCADRLDEAIAETQAQGGIVIFSQLPAGERPRNPLTSCPAVYASMGEGDEAPAPPNEFPVRQILKELKVESVRWLDPSPDS